MREIRFRGMRKDNGEWVFGDLITKPIKNLYLKEAKRIVSKICKKQREIIANKASYWLNKEPFLNAPEPEFE